MPAVDFRVFDRANGAQLTALANADGRRCQDVDNDTGTGGVTLGLADADLAYMVEGNIVRCYVDGDAAYSWVVGPMDQATVAPSEEQAEERRITGRGTLGLWADGIVYPETSGSGVTFPPLGERRVVDVRRFDFAAVGYDDSGWPAAVVVPPPPALVPLDGTPSGWPLASQDWIWSRARTGSNHPPGHSYFRHAFSVGAATQASVYITADNGFEVFLDGELLLSEMRTPVLWAFSRSVQVQLTPGTHLIAVKAVNHAVANIPVNPAGVAMVVVALDTSGDPASVITSTGAAGWKCADYPAEPPGMTVGRIVTTLYTEAQARGALGGLTLGFSATRDSAGVAWPNAPDVALPVGDDYLQVLRKLSELYCDVAMDPGSLRLDAWVSRGTNRSGSVSFTIGANITALSHKGGEQARTSAILGRFGDHWLERTGGGRRQEKFLELGSATSSAQAQRMTDAALAERSLPIIATTTGLEPTAGTVPWVHFKVGDQVSVPNAGGAMVAGRVKSISLTETQDDYDFVVEVGSIESEILDRLQRLARKTGHGALDGNFANATASTGSEGATDPTGGLLTSATPDLSLNSLTDVASVWDTAPIAGDFLSWNPDLGMSGMWEPASVVQDVGTTVVPEQAFGLAATPGVSPFPASKAHTHGTPLARHPQTGYPYVDFGHSSPGDILLGCTAGEHSPAFLGTEDVGTYMRSFFTSPTGAQGWGRAAVDLYGHDDGKAVVKLYNDFANGQYGSAGTPSAPFSLQLEGDLTLLPIANTPAVAPSGQARMYYDQTLGKTRLSENGGAYRDIGSGSVTLGTTVVAETAFSQTSAAGSGTTASKVDHTHGTPLPRHPQSGFPYVDFSGAGVVMGRLSTEFQPAQVGTQDLTTAERMFLVSPMRSGTSGRASVALIGKTDGTAIVSFYNDIDTDNAIGDPDPPTGAAAKPFGLELTGDFTFFTIANTPPVAPSGQVKLYNLAGKLKLSENGGSYRDIGEANVASLVSGETQFGQTPNPGTSASASRADHTHGTPSLGTTVVSEKLFNDLAATAGTGATAARSDHTHGTPAPGAAGSFLVTDTAGTGAMWAAVTEIYFDDTNNRIGIGATAPQERLSVRDGTAGLISTFFGPIGNNSIAVGNDKTAANSLQIGYNDTGDYGWLSVYGDAAGSALVIDNGGNVGIGVTAPGAKLDVVGRIAATGSASEFSVYRRDTNAHVWSIYSDAGALRFFDQSGSANRVTINQTTGNVGLGVDPTDKLHVAGDIRIAAGSQLYTKTARPSLVGARFKAVDDTTAERMYITSPQGATGWGVGVVNLVGKNDGSATAAIFNDLDVNGNLGLLVNKKPLRLTVDGGTQNSTTVATSVLHIVTNNGGGGGTYRVGLSMQADTTANIIRVQTDIAGFLFRNSDDTAYVPLAASAFNVNSARESKSKVRALKVAAARDSILALKPCLFDRPGAVSVDTRRKGPPTHHGGLIADEVAEHIPEAVTWLDGKPHGLDYAPIVARLIKTVQDQAHRLEALEAK